jgi:hypothetical protein
MKVNSLFGKLLSYGIDQVAYARAHLALTSFIDTMIFLRGDIEDGDLRVSGLGVTIIHQDLLDVENNAQAAYDAGLYAQALGLAKAGRDIARDLQDARTDDDLALLVQDSVEYRKTLMMSLSQSAWAVRSKAGPSGQKASAAILADVQRRMSFVADFDVDNEYIEAAVAAQTTIELLQQFIGAVEDPAKLAWLLASLQRAAA